MLHSTNEFNGSYHFRIPRNFSTSAENERRNFETDEMNKKLNTMQNNRKTDSYA